MSGTACTAQFTAYDGDGKPVTGGSIYLPEYLDWLPIEVKVHWFRCMGHGPAATKHVVFHSQGEQRLIFDITLQPLTFQQHKEKTNDTVRNEVEDFIEKGGYSRVPRNQ